MVPYYARITLQHLIESKKSELVQTAKEKHSTDEHMRSLLALDDDALLTWVSDVASLVSPLQEFESRESELNSLFQSLSMAKMRSLLPALQRTKAPSR